MLLKEELVSIARFEGLKPWQEEKKYVQLAILNSIYSFVSNELVFKGGTALFLAYNWKRFSQDLDFTLDKPFGLESLPEKISRDLELLGMESKLKIIKNDDMSFSFKLGVKGPLYTKEIERCYVKIEISRRESVVLGYEPVKIYHNFPDLPDIIVPVMNLEEIGAEKVRAVLTRDETKDLLDLYFVVGKVRIRMDLINKKLKYYNIKFSREKFENKVIELLERMEEIGPIFIGNLPRKEEVRRRILSYSWIIT